jgi:arginyl-tRNA synthetase
MGYARLCSIQRRARSLGIEPRTHPIAGEWAKLVHPDELAMAHRIGDFPDVVSEAARQREPHRIVFYLQELALDFQSYFTRLKGESDPILPPAPLRATAGWEARWDFGKTRARLAWIEALRVVYASALDLVGVSAPERMERPAAEKDAAGAPEQGQELDEDT